MKLLGWSKIKLVLWNFNKLDHKTNLNQSAVTKRKKNKNIFQNR